MIRRNTSFSFAGFLAKEKPFLYEWALRTPRASVQVRWTDTLLRKGFPSVLVRGHFGAALDALASHLQSYGRSGIAGENPDARYIDARWLQGAVDIPTSFMHGKERRSSPDGEYVTVAFDPTFMRANDVGRAWASQEARRMEEYGARVAKAQASYFRGYSDPKANKERAENLKALSDKYRNDWILFTAILNAFAVEATADEATKATIRTALENADKAKARLETDLRDAERKVAEMEREAREKREEQERRTRLREARRSSGKMDEDSLEAFIRLGGKYADRLCNTRAQGAISISVESDGKVYEPLDKNGKKRKVQPVVSTQPEKLISDGYIAFPCKNSPPNAVDASEGVKNIIRHILDQPTAARLTFVPDFASWGEGEVERLSSGEVDTSNLYAVLQTESKIEISLDPVMLGAVLSRVGDVFRFEQREDAPLTPVLVTGKKGVGIVMPLRP